MFQLSPTKTQLLKLGGPAAARFLALGATEVFGFYFIVQLGADAIAGVIAAEGWIWIALYGVKTCTQGSLGLITRAIGSGDSRTIRIVQREAVHFSMLLAVPVAGSLALAGPTLLEWQGLSDSAMTEALPFLYVLLVGVPIYYLSSVGQLFIDAHGATKVELWIVGVSAVLSLPLYPLFILGWGPIPAMGSVGFAIAILSQWSLELIARIVVARKFAFVPPLKSFLRFSRKYMRTILVVGAPMALIDFTWLALAPLMTAVVLIHGDAALAGMGIGERIMLFPLYSYRGLAIGAGILVGQTLGASTVSRAKAVARESRVLASWGSIPFVVLFVVFPEQLVGLFTQDSQTTKHAVDFVVIIGVGTIFVGWTFVYDASFAAFGRTRLYAGLSSVILILRYLVAFVAVAILGTPIIAVWFSISGGTALYGIMGRLLFRRIELADTAAELD